MVDMIYSKKSEISEKGGVLKYFLLKLIDSFFK